MLPPALSQVRDADGVVAYLDGNADGWAARVRLYQGLRRGDDCEALLAALEMHARSPHTTDVAPYEVQRLLTLLTSDRPAVRAAVRAWVVAVINCDDDTEEAPCLR